MSCLIRRVLLAVGVLLLAASTDGFAPSFNSKRLVTKAPARSASFSIHKSQRTSSSSSLQMVSPGVAVAAVTGAITGGLFAGSLHAISGTFSIPFGVFP
jgi:hypothetical protein